MPQPQTLLCTTAAALHADYDGFIARHTPKRTTDDCYTPPHIYQAVTDWVSTNLLPLDGRKILRPFYPGGDYTAQDYTDPTTVVIDNPPFSILAQILRFYSARRVPFFLFAPALTLFSATEIPGITYIITGTSIVYENGAKISTSFISNLYTDGTRLHLCHSLHAALTRAQLAANPSKAARKISYPPALITAAVALKYIRRGLDLRVHTDHCHRVTRLDNSSRPIFGSGYLVSTQTAQTAQTVQTVQTIQTAEPPETIQLSDREKSIIATLDRAHPATPPL